MAPFGETGAQVSLPMTVAGEHRLDLDIRWRCTWDRTSQYLAIEDSRFVLGLPHLREPLVRVEYQRMRDYAPAHVQIHAESSALGYLLAFAQTTTDPPKTQVLHLPVGGRRFRPCMEDVLEFAIIDLGVEADDGWREAVKEGRKRWRDIQLRSTIRDAVFEDPTEGPSDIAAALDAAVREQAVGGTE